MEIAPQMPKKTAPVKTSVMLSKRVEVCCSQVATFSSQEKALKYATLPTPAIVPTVRADVLRYQGPWGSLTDEVLSILDL
jgi:hypothetical protein